MGSGASKHIEEKMNSNEVENIAGTIGEERENQVVGVEEGKVMAAERNWSWGNRIKRFQDKSRRSGYESGREEDPHNPNCKTGFYKIVTDALQTHSDHFIVNKLEAYISENWRSNLDAFHRRQVIKNVIGDAFLEGYVAVRSTGEDRHA